MTIVDSQTVIEQYTSFLEKRDFPCIAGKASVATGKVKCMVTGNLICSNDDVDIIGFLYQFVDAYRSSTDFYHSAAIIFTGPEITNEETFDALMWQRLQALAILDAKKYNYDSRVSPDPASAQFSFSIKEEAFYVIGLHPASSRKARRFKYPTLVFNPHEQFEQLRKTEKYNNLKNAIRKRDIVFSGTVNPMLHDFGEASEVYQYSGRKYDDRLEMPFKNYSWKN